MMTKTAYYMQMAQEAAAQITGSKEQWTAFLTTSARLYKYPFAEQLMIYKQRPEATACAEYDLWNDRMNRYVKRGSKGIALLDMRGEQPKLRYVFDVADTGELLIGKDLYNQMMACKDDPATSDKNEGEIQITYEKDHWVKGDLRPEHYFACTSTDADGKVTDYNKSYLDGKSEKQVIEYDVGFNQTIQVNSTADECFQHGIGRTVDDLVQAMQDVVDLENVKTKIEGLQETATGTDAETLTKQMEAVEKALTLAKDKCQKMFESGITTFQGYLDDANLCVTNCGTRSSKLELIDNRMKSQKTTFETLKSENEDIDVTETAIDLKSAEMTYEAALMATGKVMQTTLLNFI